MFESPGVSAAHCCYTCAFTDFAHATPHYCSDEHGSSLHTLLQWEKTSQPTGRLQGFKPCKLRGGELSWSLSLPLACGSSISGDLDQRALHLRSCRGHMDASGIGGSRTSQNDTAAKVVVQRVGELSFMAHRYTPPIGRMDGWMDGWMDGMCV